MGFRFLYPAKDRSAAVPTGWWTIEGVTCVGAWQAKGASDLADSYVDRSGSGNDLTTSVAPTWNVATGWTFNGSTQYLLTPIKPDETYSIFVSYANASGSTQSYIVGCHDGVNSFAVYYTNGFGSRQYWNCGNRSISGLVATAIRGFAGKATYKDGVTDGTIAAGTGTQGWAVGIGVDNYSSLSHYYTGDILAVVMYSETITAGQAASLYTNMAAL